MEDASVRLLLKEKAIDVDCHRMQSISAGRINKVKMSLDLPVKEATQLERHLFFTAFQLTVGIRPDCRVELMRSRSQWQQRSVASGSFTSLKGKDKLKRVGCCCCCCCCWVIDNRRCAAASGVITDDQRKGVCCVVVDRTWRVLRGAPLDKKGTSKPVGNCSPHFGTKLAFPVGCFCLG